MACSPTEPEIDVVVAALEDVVSAGASIFLRCVIERRQSGILHTCSSFFLNSDFSSFGYNVGAGDLTVAGDGLIMRAPR